ncbi:MAG: hypothetical protein GY780_11115, partial [bacterium]|nr:hypothetical protein [bacterium]
MGTQLRLGFAMGGGVSLGTFCGSALGEALKAVIIDGKDKNGDPFDNIVVDVFSGASAGSMSLAIMLRNLVHRTPSQNSKAKTALQQEFGSDFINLTQKKQRQLIAAQVVQDIQEEVWVREINLEKLMSGPGMETTAGLVNRRAVEKIASRYLDFPEGVKLTGRQLLGNRVLFASTISNMTPIIADSRGEFEMHEVGYLGAADGMTSKIHRELRVFDLNFDDTTSTNRKQNEEHPGRWCRYHNGPKNKDSHNGIGDLRERRCWAKIAATSIASGAFPGAFEPVVLERRDYEFGGKNGFWPKQLASRDRHPFTYVDGGTFNNEPIREAFRMASFMDAC